MATASVIQQLQTEFPNLHVLQLRAVAPLLMRLRDETTPAVDFRHYADRLMRLLAEEGLAMCCDQVVTIKTPTGDTTTGFATASRVCAVSIVRAGDSLLSAVMNCDPSIAVGKILIQRDETSKDKHPVLFYSKLPPQIATYDHVLVVDPMLATAGSILMAVKTLKDVGVEEKKIVFVNVVACPEGIRALFTQYPDVQVITSAVDRGLNEQKYIVPGLGDFGDRYFDTVSQ